MREGKGMAIGMWNRGAAIGLSICLIIGLTGCGKQNVDNTVGRTQEEVRAEVRRHLEQEPPGSRKMTETANGKVTANEQITANGKVTANEKIAVKMPGIKRGTRKNQNWHGRRQKKRSGESLLRGGMIMTILLPTGVGTIISGPESVKATALFR